MSHVVKTFISVIAIILTTLCKLTPAPAQDVFSALQDQGGILASDPSCTLGGNVAICAVVGYGGHLFVDTYNGTGWTGFQDKGGIVIGKPSCTHFGLGNVQALCGTIGTDGAVWVNVFNGTSWNFHSLGGLSISDPACTGFGNGAICAVIGANSHLFASTTSDGVTWSAFQDLNLGGTLIFNPTCMDAGFADNPAALCGAVTTAGELRTKQFNGVTSTWDPNPAIITLPTSNMSITSDPSCAAVNVAQVIICGVRGSDSALYVSQSFVSQSGVTTFPQFQSVGGVLAGAPSCASENITNFSNPLPVCAVRGPDSVLYVMQFIPTVFCVLGHPCFPFTYHAIPTTDIKGDPSCTFMLVSVPVKPSGTVSQHQVLCGVKSTDSKLWVTIGTPFP
jgi:hypothetical protein